MNKSEQINELAAALSKAQAKIKGAVKDSTNPFYKSSYADLQSIYDAIRIPFAENNLAISQTTGDTERGIVVITTLMHSSGQWIEGSLPIMAIKQDPQGIGSAITYARRYAIAAIAGVYQTDDDGESHAVRETKVTSVDALNAANYVITFGQYKDKKIKEIDLNKLQSYVDYLKNGAKNAGKPLSIPGGDLIRNFEAYKNGPSDNEPPPPTDEDQIPF